MMRKTLLLVAAGAALVHGRLAAQPDADADRGDGEAAVERGAAVYAARCAYCHDRLPESSAIEMLPGPESLSLKYGGALSPYITERADLASFGVLDTFLRRGSGSMPPFRKTEITDQDIAALAAYFARTSSR